MIVKADRASNEIGMHHTGASTSRERVSARKGRARGAHQKRSFRIDTDDAMSVHMLLQRVKTMTHRIRRHANTSDKQRVFIYRTQNTNFEVHSFGSDKLGASGGSLWALTLARFCELNKLGRFSLRTLRATVADFAEQLTGDLRAVQLLLGQSSSEITLRHYLSPGGRKRGAEAIAVAQNMRHRWAETGGRREPRDGGLADTLVSATPGIDCMDPYDSPMPGQVKGKLCSAWLGCFFCPLGYVHPDDGYSFARLVQMEAKIKDSRLKLAAVRFQEVYLPMLDRIATFQGMFTSAARMVAKGLSYLKPLPELE